MTLKQAAEKGITRLRNPGWNRKAYVEISITDGSLDAFAKLYDEPGQKATGAETPQTLPTPILNGDNWEAV